MKKRFGDVRFPRNVDEMCKKFFEKNLFYVSTYSSLKTTGKIVVLLR